MTEKRTESVRERWRAQLNTTRLYAVTDDAVESVELFRIVDVLLGAGVRLFQYRDKASSDRQRVGVAMALVERIHAGDGLLLVNDRADLAAAAGADGVHLGRGFR